MAEPSPTITCNAAPPVVALRPMERSHLDAVLAIEQEGFTNPWRRSDFETALDRADSHCLMADIGGEFVGYTVGFFVLAEFHLADFAIHRGWRRQGLGKALLVRLLAELADRPLDYVTLEVRASNEAAIGLYKGLDFRTVAIRRSYYSMPAENALVMMRALRGSLSDWTTGIRGL
jgi:ribosomal-protein-alanine N-acetyltransferase